MTKQARTPRSVGEPEITSNSIFSEIQSTSLRARTDTPPKNRLSHARAPATQARITNAATAPRGPASVGVDETRYPRKQNSDSPSNKDGGRPKHDPTRLRRTIRLRGQIATDVGGTGTNSERAHARARSSKLRTTAPTSRVYLVALLYAESLSAYTVSP